MKSDYEMIMVDEAAVDSLSGIVASLKKRTGREVSLEQALFATLEGLQREERRQNGEDLPYISDTDLLDIVDEKIAEMNKQAN